MSTTGNLPTIKNETATSSKLTVKSTDAPKLQTTNLIGLSEKLQTCILRRLDIHNLLKCRLISKEFKVVVDKVATLELLKSDRHLWNPYFTIRRYFDLNSRNILGFVRLESTSRAQVFVEENVGKIPTIESPPATIPQSPLITTPTDASTSRQAGKSQPLPPKSRKQQKASSLDAVFFTSASPQQSTPQPAGLSTNGSLFPLGSLYVRRRLQDYDSEAPKNVAAPVDITQAIIHWTTVLVEEFGSQLTSFTYDDGKRKGSDLTFPQLHSILSHLPNLISLNVTSGNYRHMDYQKRLPPLSQLKHVNLGYNATYHLHQDILNSYGTQLKRLSCSKFGYFDDDKSNSSTCNTLHKMLDFVNGARDQQPRILSSLEDLKVPMLSSQNLIHQVLRMAAASPILWSNLRRLSVHYVYRPGQNDSALADLWLFLNIISPTLQELYLDFGTCPDFVEWISVDSRPLDREVYRSCRRLRKLCISAISLLKFADLCDHVAIKFPKLRTLTFFNWILYYAESHESNFQGKYYSGGPQSPEELTTYLYPLWTKIPTLQRVSVRNLTWKGEGVYQEIRENILP